MKKILPFILVFLLALPATRYLFVAGYFPMHDDLQVMRLFELDKCFSDGQIPCRWSPDMAFGYGQAMFNFYSVFPYYLGEIIKILIPVSIITTVKILFFISLIGASIGMYLLAKELWGTLGGVLASVLYTYAPYHAMDVFVRGALSEAFALAILPFIWYSFYLLIKKPTFGRFAASALCLAALLTTHNISSLIYAPFTLVWILFWIIESKKWERIKDVILAAVFGVGLAAFFVIPVVVEKSLIQTKYLTADYFDYTAHFVSLKQLFWERKWGYGPSIFGPYDDLSFQIGWPNWWLAIPLALTSLFWFTKKERRKEGLLVFGLLGLAGLLTFMTHSRSIFIWQAVPFLSIVQFPWRFLGLVIFFLSFAAGAFGKAKFRFRRMFLFLIIFLALIFNAAYFKPQHNFYSETDQSKLSGIALEIQQKSAILDYLPKTALVAPKEPAGQNPKVISGKGLAYNFSLRSNSFFFDAQIYQEAKVAIPVMYFPGWKVISAGKEITSFPTQDYGLITISLPEGKHMISGRFENTPARTIGNNLTVIAAMLIFIGYILKINARKFLWL